MNTHKSQQQSGRSRYLSAAVSAVLSLAAASAHGDPRNGVVTSGSATISTPDANLTQIDQSSRSATINWQSFDVAAQERVIFNQPTSSSVALNRIQAQDPSQIYGSISANGRVFLINPNGIIFGASARINVGSLVASSLDLTAADAQSGHYAFSAAAGQSGAIVNGGQIKAANGGSVTLLGGSVLNNGLIIANYGSVNLGAGRSATLDFAGDGLVRFQVDEGLLSNGSGAGAAVDNAGEIVADGGQVLLTARQANDVIARAVNNDGVIRAARIENVGGHIRLVGPEGSVANSGTLDATGVGATSTGGDVQVLGAQIALSNTSIVDVTGSAGGGTALIGGSFHGADTTVLNAQQTDVQSGAVIRANSLVSGDAGQVVVWSDGNTTLNGEIIAQATGFTGNGGRAEVSGRDHLSIGGHAQLQSRHGTAGTLLLDPGSVTIVDGDDTAPTDFDVINDGWIIDQLSTSGLTVQTSDSIDTLGEDLRVTGAADISWANGNALTLIGASSIALDAGSNIANTGSGSLTLQSGGAVAIGGTVSLAGGLTVTAGDDITQSAALTIGGAASFTSGNGKSVLLDNAGNSFGGSVSILAASGSLLNVTLSDLTAIDLLPLAITGDLSVTAGGDITQSGALAIGGQSAFTAAGGSSVVLNALGNTFTGTVSFGSSGPGRLQDVSIRDANSLDLRALSITGDLTADAGALTQSGALLVDGNASFTAANGQSVILGNAGNAFGGTVGVAASGGGNLVDVTLRDSTALQLQALTIGGNLVATSGGALTQSGALNIAGNSSFAAAGGQPVTLGNVNNVFGGTVGFASSGGGNLQDVIVNDTTALDLQALSINGNLTASASTLTQSGALTAGNVSFTANGGQSVVLGNGGNVFTGTVSLAARGGGNLLNVTLNDSTALALQALTIGGNLAITSGGSITQSGALNVGGNSAFIAGNGQSITLGDSGNVFAGAVNLAATTGNLLNVTVHDSTALDLQALAIGGNLDVAAASLSQSGALNVAGTSSFAANGGQSILLTTPGNLLSGGIAFTSNGGGNLQNVTLQNSTNIDLQGLTLNGDLNAEAAGGITQSGALVVAGNSSFIAASGQSIALGNAGNMFTGTVGFAASGGGNLQNVTVRDSTALDLQALTIGGNLAATSNASLTQSGALNIAGSSTFTAGAGQSITLNNVGNVFTGLASFASVGPGNLQNLTVNDSTALQLQALTLDGNLTVGANAVTQSGALVVGGNSSFSAAGGQSVLLGNADNVFTGTVSLAAGGGGNLQNVTLTDSTALQLQALTIGGDLAATSASSLTQSGALIVGGNSAFTAGSGQSITLSNTANSLAGTVSFAAGGAGNLQNVTVHDSNALDLQALSIDGALDVTGGGALTQSGALSVAGAASFRTLNDAGAAITLDGVNSFGSVQAAVRDVADTGDAAADIVIRESNSTSLGNLRTAAGQTVSVTSAGAISALAGTAITAGSLTLVAGGDIGTGATPLALIAPNTGINAVSAGNIDLVSDGNIRVSDVRAGGSLSLTSAGGSILDDNVDGVGSQLVANTLVLQAAGSIGEAVGAGSGMLDVQAASVSAHAQGGGLHLDRAQGDLNIRQLTAAGPVSIQAAAGSIVDDPTDGIAATIVSISGGVQLRALNNIGTVTDLPTRQGAAIGINTNGGAISAQVTSAVGQVNLDIAGGSSLTASAGAIFAGGGGRLLLQSTGDLSLDAFNSAITGFAEVGFSSDATLHLPDAPTGLLAGPLNTLFVRGATDVVRTGRIFDLAADHLVFESGALGGDVTLNTNVGTLDATIGNGGSLSVVQSAGALTLGSISAGGNVAIRAATILDDGDLTVVTRISAGDAISLQADNGVGAADGSGGGRIDTAGNLVSVLAGSGPVFISHLGNLEVSGATNDGLIDIVAPNGSITVNSTLRASGSLTLTAGAEIADANDTSTHLVAGDANLTGTSIGSQGNALNIDVGSLTAAAPNGVYVSAANAVQLRSIAAADVVINATGAVTDDGDAQTRIVASSVQLSGAAIGAPGAGNEIDTSVDRLSATAANDGIYIGQAGSMELGTISATGTGNDIAINASGAIADDGDNATRISGGNLALSATSIGSAVVNGEVDTQVASLTASASGGGIYVREADELQLRGITAAGNDIAIAAGGALTDDGNDTTRITGAGVSLSATAVGATDNRIDTAANVLSATASNGGIYIDEADGVTLADVRSSGAGNTVNLRTANNGSIIVQNLVTQGGAVNLTAGGSGSLNVTGTLESNNGVVNLTSGDVLAVPGLDTGTGSAVLHTVNDVNVGTITASSISITSDTGSVLLGTANAGTGTVAITANNGTIVDSTATSVTAGQATLSARSIGSADNPLNVAIGTLTASASAGGVFVDDSVGLTVNGISATGAVRLATSGAFIQSGAITSTGNAISVFARSLDMDAAATTISGGADITYVANAGDANLAVLDAASGRVLVIAADNVFSSLVSASPLNNFSGSAVEVRAGGLAAGSGQIGRVGNALAIATSVSAGRTVFLIVPAMNGIQTSTPNINYSGSPTSLLLKGYSGSAGTLLFDAATAFSAETVLLNGESIVPLLNGRVAVNTDSLSAAKQALSSGVINRVNIDWAAFDPNVSLFGTLDPALRLPSDQLDEEAAQ
jgi:filamentous hemagglutinin family protein